MVTFGIRYNSANKLVLNVLHILTCISIITCEPLAAYFQVTPNAVLGISFTALSGAYLAAFGVSPFYSLRSFIFSVFFFSMAKGLGVLIAHLLVLGY